MVKTAIMQPYLFPYLGYFQLISSVDKFVFLNDVNFIKKGWINRNRILVNNKEYTFTVPLVKPSQNSLICDTEISSNYGVWRDKMCKTIEMSYKNAPFYDSFMPVFLNVLNSNFKYIDELAINSIVQILTYLGLNDEVEIIISNGMDYDRELKGQDKIVFLCDKIGADVYVNAIGGKELYDYNTFLNVNIELKFVNPKLTEYHQISQEFIPGLSIIDVCMNCSIEDTRAQLNNFELELW